VSILVNEQTRLLVQGITGRDGAFHAQAMQGYGTQVVGGVTPGKAGQRVGTIPVFNSVFEARAATGANASIIFVPAAFAADAVYEAADAGIELVVCISEGVPTLDVVKLTAWLKSRSEACRGHNTRLLGPNCPGLISPGRAKVGIMPDLPFKPGKVGVVSRSGTLTYEIAWQITSAGFGESTVVGIGGDPIIGTNFIDCLSAFKDDPQTEAIVIVGEIGGSDEEDAARFVRANVRKPVFGFIAGQTAPADKRMGHAGAIISGGSGLAADKIKAFQEAGIEVCFEPAEIATKLKARL
jgi:succinyl-CoA synthetase alpha subunit